MRKSAIALLALLLAYPAVLSSSLAQTPQQRREELLKIPELVNDPDPLMRIANFESIVKSNDALKIQTAIKIAMTSGDSSLRSLALQAYLAATQSISFEVTLPPAQMKQWQAAKDDKMRRDMLVRDNRSVYTMASAEEHTAGRVQFLFLDAQVGAARGQVVYSQDSRRSREQPAEYRVLGERIQFTSQIRFGGYSVACLVEIAGTRDLTLTGTLSCNHPRFGPVGLFAAMY